MDDLNETEMRKLAKHLKLGDGSVHYNIKSTPTMLQQWLDHSENPTWAEFTLAMDKVGKHYMFLTIIECRKPPLQHFDMP